MVTVFGSNNMGPEEMVSISIVFGWETKGTEFPFHHKEPTSLSCSLDIDVCKFFFI